VVMLFYAFVNVGSARGWLREVVGVVVVTKGGVLHVVRRKPEEMKFLRL